jgi:tetratricopeptide (TPR) repeat protein
MKEGNNAEAKEYFFEALNIDDQNPYALYNLGVIYEQEGNKRAAMESYQRVILTGTALKAAESTDPDVVGLSLVELARQRLEALRGVEKDNAQLFERENSK